MTPTNQRLWLTLEQSLAEPGRWHEVISFILLPGLLPSKITLLIVFVALHFWHSAAALPQYSTLNTKQLLEPRNNPISSLAITAASLQSCQRPPVCIPKPRGLSISASVCPILNLIGEYLLLLIGISHNNLLRQRSLPTELHLTTQLATVGSTTSCLYVCLRWPFVLSDRFCGSVRCPPLLQALYTILCPRQHPISRLLSVELCLPLHLHFN